MSRGLLAAIGLLVLGVTFVVTGPIAPASAAPAPRTIPAATNCTNPQHGSIHPGVGLQPRQLGAAYGLTSLWQQGYRGQGKRVAILLFSGESLDTQSWSNYSQCWGPFHTPVQDMVIPGAQHPGGEGIFDPQAIVAAAPDAQVYEMISADPLTDFADWPTMIAAALNPANTGGQLVDAITTSFPTCEAVWNPAAVTATEAALRHAAQLGVKFFAAGGDSGSPSWYPNGGGSSCVQHPVDVSAPPVDPHLGVNFPGSSPYVTDVGGSELAINGSVPFEGSHSGGTITDEIVWNQALPGAPTSFYAGGGGTSTFYSVNPDAPWQADLGLTGPESKPDITAIAGSPKFPNGGIGTSGASPLMAGAFAVLDGYLQGHHAAPLPVPLNAELYHLAANPATYASVFNDVVHGTNDVLGLGCCVAHAGYDNASGLGSIRFDALADALAPAPPTSSPTPTPTSRPTSSPTPTPPRVPTSASVPTPSAAAITAAASPAASPIADPLAATGGQHVPGLLALGIGLIVAGSVLTFARRRT